MDRVILSPFMSLDGKDKKGIRAEVRVQMGYAPISVFEEKKGSNSVKVGFIVEGLKHNVLGRVDKVQEKSIYDVLKEAYDNDEAVFFRIEKQRQKHVDRSLPMLEISPPKDMALAFENTFTSIVAVKKEYDDEWIVGDKMITSFKEDSLDFEHRQEGVYKASDEDFEEEKEKATAKNEAPKTFTNSSYKVRTQDGTVNTESFALMAPVHMLTFVKKTARENIGDDVFTLEEEKRIAAGLLNIAGKIQKACFGVDTVNIGAYSHRTAEEIVKSAVSEFVPLKDFTENFDEEWTNYAKLVFVTSKKIADFSIEQIEKIDS